MLPHYSAFKVAEQFRVLDAIAPGRIDLGLGRAPGSDGRTAFALNPLADQRPAHFPSDVRDLMAWVTGAALPRGTPSPPCAPIRPARPRPRSGCAGSSDYGAQVAAHFGLPYAFASFFADGQPARRRSMSTASSTSPAASGPRRTPRCACGRWRPRARRRRSSISPRAASSASCATAASSAPWRRRPRHWRTPTRRPRLARIAEQRKSAFVGTGAQVAERIEELARRLDVQEMAVVTWAPTSAYGGRATGFLPRRWASRGAWRLTLPGPLPWRSPIDLR